MASNTSSMYAFSLNRWGFFELLNRRNLWDAVG